MATITLQKAIDQAKANPNSDFATKIRQGIESGSFDEAAKKQGVDLTKYGRPAPEQNVFERISSGIKEKGQNVEQAISGTGDYAGKSAPERGVAATAQGFSAISNTVYNALPDTARKALDTIGGGIGKGVEHIADKISNSKLLQEAVTSGDTSKLESALKIASDLGLIAGEVAGTEGAVKGIDKTVTGAKVVAQKTSDVVGNAAEQVGKIVPKTKDAFLNFVSPSLDEKVINSLKKVSTEKFDDFVTTAEKAATDAELPSVYEKVASSMESATEQIDNQVKSLSQQKKTIIQKAKTGLTDFSKETGQTILDINKKLKASPIATSFIERLKTVKTKIDADRVIDDLQNELYKGNTNMTIPVGSTEDKILRKAIGEYNSKLKTSLPPAYAKLNAEIAERLDTLNALNTALGQTVDGVAIRGAGLVKQFFSPAGTKTKQLFKYIKDNTGVDLASDAVLAKYVGEAFGDAKVRSLLEGIPSTTSGVLEQITNFAIEKIGAKKALNEAKKQGILKRGRSITNPGVSK